MSKSSSLASVAVPVLWAASLAVAPASQAVEPSGTTVAVIQSAAASGATGARALEIEAPVYMGDRIKTGSIGEAQLMFRDQTRLVVGANSQLLIDSFVFQNDSTATKVGMRALRGTFRFITGVSRKQAYAISTPTMTIGVRGTRFDFSIGPNGETLFALFEGGARVCNRSGRCLEVTGRCSVVVSDPDGTLRPIGAGEERTARLRASFPYISSQARLLPDFRVDTSSCRTQHATLDQDPRPVLAPTEAPAPANRPPPPSPPPPPGPPPPPPPPGPPPPPPPPGPPPPPPPPGPPPPPPPPGPPPPPPPPSGGPGNPGNNKEVGGAGENPGGGNFGGGSRGKKH